MSSQRNGILAGGNFITDYVKLIDAWPEQDTLASIRSESMSNGGGPYNILKDLACLQPELPLEACGLVGEDANGQWIVDDCEAHKIDVKQLHRTSEAATSYTDAMTVASTGRRTFFHQRGANALLSPSHFDFSTSNARVFCLGFLMLLDSLDVLEEDGETGASQILKAAGKAGLITAVDCVSTPNSQFREIVLASLRQADVLFINEFEIGQVLGREVKADRVSLESAARELENLGGAQIVVHCASGAVVADASGIIGAQGSLSLPGDFVAGASGAGDAFAAGYLLGVHDGKEVKDCLLYAVASAAQSLSHASPSGGMTSLSECLALANRVGFRSF